MHSSGSKFNLHQLYGSGLALILIILGLYWYLQKPVLLYSAIALIVLLMIWPSLFLLFTRLWFAFGYGLGYVMNRIILGSIFIIMVLPMGLLKRKRIRKRMQIDVFGNDPLQSAFIERNYTYSNKDFEKPF